MSKRLGLATAYGYAKSKGYPGTEQEFATLMANYGTVAQEADASAKAAAKSASDAQDVLDNIPADYSELSSDVGLLKNAVSVITKVDYDNEDLSTYTSTETNSSFNCTNIPIAPNANDEYFIKSAIVKTRNPNTNVKFAVWTIAPYYDQPDSMNRKRFTKKYDLDVVVSNDSGLATIVFDVPIKIIPDVEVLMASCQTNQSMAYGTYVDSSRTSFIYDNSRIWYDVNPGESPNYAAIYVTSGDCPWYEVKYVLSADAIVKTEIIGDIEQKKYNLSPYDPELSSESTNAVRNSVLYDELNIIETKEILPTDTTRKNNEAVQPQGYNGWFTIAYVNETDAVKLKELDIYATTGTSVRLGIWTFRRHAEGSQMGYLTLKSIIDTVIAADSHAVFNIDNIDFDPSTEFLGVASSSGGIGYNTGVVNGFVGIWYNSDKGFYDMPVGSENSQLMSIPGKTESTSGTTQGNYTITYKLAESKTVTTVTNVKEAVQSHETEIEKLKENSKNTAAVSDVLRAPINKYFVVIVDDVTRDALKVSDRLLAIGVRPAYALKMESIGLDITWDEVRQLQSMGFEICFHGMLHSRYPDVGDEGMIADIAQYKAICKEQGVSIYGYAGPNHYPLPVGAFKEFEWARGPKGLTTYGGPNRLATTFAAVAVWSCDPGSSGVPKADMIAAASNVQDNQYLTPMLHCQNLYDYLDDYLEVFNAWIAAGLQPLRPMDAVKQSLFNAGGLGNNSTFEIQAGTATNPYYLIAGNGTVLQNSQG